MRESDIIHENGRYWVGKGKGLDDGRRVGAYSVYYSHPGHHSSVSVATFRDDADGKSLAIAKCDYLAKFFPVKTEEAYRKLLQPTPV